MLQTRFEEGEAFDGEVTGYNKGGLLVNVEGVHAFVPLSQVVGVRPDQDGEGGLASAVGKQLRLKVIEINRRRNRVILSERAALQEWRSQQKDRLLAELKEGEIRKGRVSSVRSFGVFIDLGGADGLAHLSEVSWDRNKTPEEMYRIGDEVDVYVMKVDPETKKIALSLRRAQPEEWDLIVDKYQVGRVVPGMVTKLVTFGAFARIEGPVEGLIHVSELVDRRIAHPKEVVREGDLLPLKIVRIERDRHRLGLSLRDARDEGDAHGLHLQRRRRGDRRAGGHPHGVRGARRRDGRCARAPERRASTPSPTTRRRRTGRGGRRWPRRHQRRRAAGAGAGGRAALRRWRRRSRQPRRRASDGRPRTQRRPQPPRRRPSQRIDGARTTQRLTRRRADATESDGQSADDAPNRASVTATRTTAGPAIPGTVRSEDQGERRSRDAI